jgi:hypothetical protein
LLEESDRANAYNSQHQQQVADQENQRSVACEVHQGVRFVAIDSGVGVEDIVGEVFPCQNQYGGHQENAEDFPINAAGVGVGDGGTQQNWQDSNAIHGGLDGCHPELFGGRGAGIVGRFEGHGTMWVESFS